MKEIYPQPPRLFLRFFRWYCHPKLVRHIEGDLMEVYNERVREWGKRKADAKFVVDVLLLCRPGIIRDVGRRKMSSRNSNTNLMLINYFKVAFRSMIKQKTYNILNILGLSIGISSGLIIAMHIRHELSYEKTFVNYENIYRVHRDGWAASSPVLASEFKAFFPEVESIGRFTPYGVGPRVVNTDRNNPGEATGYCADSTVLKIFDLKVLDGDPRSLAAPNTAVITQEMATRYFGDESAVGKVLTIDGDVEMPVTAVIENLPPNSHLKFDFLVSMSTFYHEREWADQNRGWMTMYTYALLRPGGIANVSERMPQFIRKYYTGDLDVEQEVATGGWRLMPLKNIHLYSDLEKEMSPNSSIVYVYILVAVELLILIVASANFMSLFTTQALRRVKEAGMRKILGARPGQLSIQFLTEVIFLVSISAFLAIILYQLALPFYNNVSGKALGTWEFLEPDNLTTIGIMLLVVVVISGLYPALFVARFKPSAYLREGKLPASMPNLVRSGLVVFQFLVSVSLIAAAIIVRQQMAMMKNKDLGFEKDQVVNVKLYGDLLGKAYDTDAFRNEFLRNPDILALGRTDRIIGERLSIESVSPVGKEDDEIPDVRVLRVDEGYLDAMNIKVAEGRNFSRSFNDSSAFIINESAANALGLADPVGEVLINQSNGPRKGQIVGVVKDYHFATLHAEIEPLVIEFNPGWTDNLVFKIRAGKASETLDYIERTTKRLAPNSLFIYQFLDDRVDALYKSEDTMGKVFQFFSVLAIIIACLGLFGLSSYTIETRTKEIGIRKVLGATVTTIVALVSSRMFRLILIGFLIAVPVTWYAMNRWLDNFAYKIVIEWWVFALTGIIVVLVAALAIGFRTIRVAIANPVNSLRNE